MWARGEEEEPRLAAAGSVGAARRHGYSGGDGTTVRRGRHRRGKRHDASGVRTTVTRVQGNGGASGGVRVVGGMALRPVVG